MWNARRTDISHPRSAPAAKADHDRPQDRARCPASAERGIGRWRAAARIGAMVVCMLAAAMTAAAAQEMQAPRLSHIHPDWSAVAADLGSIVPPPASPSQPDASAPAAPSISDLNRATADL